MNTLGSRLDYLDYNYYLIIIIINIGINVGYWTFFWWTRTRRSRVRVNQKKGSLIGLKHGWLSGWKFFFLKHKKYFLFAKERFQIWHNPLLLYVKVYLICLNIEIIMKDYRAKKRHIIKCCFYCTFLLTTMRHNSYNWT